MSVFGTGLIPPLAPETQGMFAQTNRRTQQENPQLSGLAQRRRYPARTTQAYGTPTAAPNQMPSPQQAYGAYKDYQAVKNFNPSSIGTSDWVTAAIQAQLKLSDMTDREYEGVKTGNVTDGHMATEPWLAYAHDKLGLDITPGEKFDAAVANGDWKKAMARSPGAAYQWANPFGPLVQGGARKVVGKTASKFVDPLASLFGMF